MLRASSSPRREAVISAGIRRLPLKAPCAARAVTRAVIGEQGLITEAGYQEQAKSYEDMTNAAGVASRPMSWLHRVLMAAQPSPGLLPSRAYSPEAP
jgi:hypothetical protein